MCEWMVFPQTLGNISHSFEFVMGEFDQKDLDDEGGKAI